jgi:hypothetical protein
MRLLDAAKIGEEVLLWATGCGGRCNDGTTTVLPKTCADAGRKLGDAIRATEEREAKCPVDHRVNCSGSFCDQCGAPLKPSWTKPKKENGK